MELERIQDFDKRVIPGDNGGSMIMERIQNFDKWADVGHRGGSRWVLEDPGDTQGSLG